MLRFCELPWALPFNCRPIIGPKTNLSRTVSPPLTVFGRTWLVVLYPVFVWYGRNMQTLNHVLMTRLVHRNATSRYCECHSLPTAFMLTFARLSPECITSQQYGYPMGVYKVHYTGIRLTVSGRLLKLKEYSGGIKASRLATYPRHNLH